MTWSNHDGVITHLQPDILECEVKQTLGSVTTNQMNGGDGIPAELFNILKDDAVKVLHSVCQQIWKTQQWSLYSNPKEEQCQRMLKYHITALVSHASKVMLKILQAKLQQYVN